MRELPDSTRIKSLMNRSVANIALPTVYNDALSYQELIYALMKYVEQLEVNISDWNTWLNDFVQTFDNEIQETVTAIVQEWIDNGYIEVVISEALQTQIDDVNNQLDNYITTNEQDKLSIESQLEQITLNINNYKHLVIDEDWTTAIQTAFDDLYNNGGGSITFPIGTYKTTKPILVKTVANVSAYDEPFIKIIGNGNKSSMIDKKGSEQLYDLDATLILIKGSTLVIDDGWSGVQFENIKIKNSSDANTAYALYGKRGSRLLGYYSSFETLKGSERYALFIDDAWSWGFKDCMFTGDYGFYNNNGTSLTLENTCAFTSKIGYKTGCVYSTYINPFVELSSGIGYIFQTADVYATALGMESPNCHTLLRLENSNVNIGYFYANQSNATEGTVIEMVNGSSIKFDTLRLVMEAENKGYLWKSGSSNKIEIDNLILGGGAGRFLYSQYADLGHKNTEVRINRSVNPPAKTLTTITKQHDYVDWFMASPSIPTNSIVMGLKDTTIGSDGTDLKDIYAGAAPNTIYFNSDFSNKKVLGWVRETHQGGQLKNAVFKYVPLILSGWAEQRPLNPVEGMMFYDKFVEKPIWWDGTNWVDATGTIIE